MRRYKVLYASSDPDSIDRFVHQLSGFGYDVIPCTRGETAVRLIEEHQFDLAIISIDLIGLNGFEICRSIRERYDDNDLPIVIRAVEDSEEWRLMAFESGANCFAFEPMQFERLDSVMHNLLKFKSHHEGHITVACALGMLDAAFNDYGEGPCGERVWPRSGDYSTVVRLGKTLLANHVDLTSERQDEIHSLLCLLMHIAESTGSISSAVSRFSRICRGTPVEHIARELSLRLELNRCLSASEAVCPECLEAVVVLMGFATQVVCFDRSPSEAISAMRESGYVYDDRLLNALGSIASKDEFLDSIFASPSA
ncbi:MAG: response regulator [Collinsella sp.]|nr:response regulator [Collinsella sp.]